MREGVVREGVVRGSITSEILSRKTGWTVSPIHSLVHLVFVLVHDGICSLPIDRSA